MLAFQHPQERLLTEAAAAWVNLIRDILRARKLKTAPAAFLFAVRRHPTAFATTEAASPSYLLRAGAVLSIEDMIVPAPRMPLLRRVATPEFRPIFQPTVSMARILASGQAISQNHRERTARHRRQRACL